MSEDEAVEVLRLPASDTLFAGLPDAAVAGAIVIAELDRAFLLAFEQSLPEGYRVWLDAIEQCRARLRRHPRFDAAQAYVERWMLDCQRRQAGERIEHRKRRLAGSNTPRDDFRWSEAREDAMFVLATLAIHRWLGLPAERWLDGVLQAYRLGGWPCGLHEDGRLVIFDPASLR
ncbi:hypothetical protein WJ59_31215 [Burkholderia gladioli]|uniref:hypothetical protein n=1 Tax=Burkholderia gladioli TaxID=28095 RepID=UPI000755A9ED|nr:hypothetical protein [Burkholderia gladioli]KVM59988.1 hypothetical protein WJ59_31215 [Burkholderia gladioli]